MADKFSHALELAIEECAPMKQITLKPVRMARLSQDTKNLIKQRDRARLEIGTYPSEKAILHAEYRNSGTGQQPKLEKTESPKMG